MAGNRPDTGDVHVNALMTNVSIGYINDNYIADKVFPIVPVNKQSDYISSFDKEYWFRDEMGERAPGTLARESGWSLTNTATYFCISYALRKIIPDEIRANADDVFHLDKEAVLYLTDKAFMRRERDFATTVNASGSWTTTGTISAKWSDFANSDPIDNVMTTKRTINDLIGREPNTIVAGKIVRDRLLRHPDCLDLIKYTQRGIVNEQLLAVLLGVKNFYTMTGVYETADEGADSSMSALWDDDMVLLYVADSPSLMSPSAGYTFVWKPLTGGGAQYIRRYRMEPESADVFEIRSYFDIKAMAAGSGAHWSDCVD